MAELDLTTQLRDLYRSMARTQAGFAPYALLTALRRAFPQFAERSKTGHGFAQQDAEEAWSQIIAQTRSGYSSTAAAAAAAAAAKAKPRRPRRPSSTTTYMAGEFESTLECDEQAARDGGEEVTRSKEAFLKLNCHIDSSINHLRDGIMAGLTEKVEKRSSVLERDAAFTKTSKISRLPKYLTVHFVRFFWKREVQKKAKIMRKVTFPHELDAVEFCTDALRKMLVPVRDKVREITKDEDDMERARKRRKTNPLLDGEPGAASGSGTTAAPSSSKKEGAKEDAKKDGKAASSSAGGDVDMTADETYKTDAEVEAEKQAALLAAKKELHALISPELAADEGTNQSGLYELRGVVTHQGASADSGHYTAYVKKSASTDAKTGKRTGDEDGNWWWFNDNKVTQVTPDKIDALAGGGESHSALILLYRAIPLPSADGTVEQQ